MRTFPIPSRPFRVSRNLAPLRYVIQSFNGHTWCTISKPRSHDECVEMARNFPADAEYRIAMVEEQ